MKKFIIFLFLFILALVLYFIFRNGPLIDVKIKDQTLKMEVADEKEELELGLMRRETLEEDRGMIFVYEKGITPNFWMKDMFIPLDMIFLSPDKTINHIEKNVPPCNEQDDEKCPTYTSPFSTQYILEVTAGYTDKYAVKEGDLVEFSLKD